MSAPTIFRSTDVGAPVMIGAPASLTDLLDACLVNGYGGVLATGVLTLSGTPSDGEQVVIGATTYTFKTTLTPAANQVLIGGSAANAIINLARAINLNGTANTDYGSGTVRNASVTATAVTATTLTVTARANGTGANSVATTETLGSGSWANATLTGGTAGQATAVLTSDNTVPADGDQVVIGARTYTFKGTLTGAANEVFIGADADTTLQNLRDAINGGSGNGSGGGAGSEYGTGTVAHDRVTCSTVTAHAVTITAIYFGTGANSLATTETSAHLSFGSVTMTGGAGKDPAGASSGGPGWTRPYTGTNIVVYRQAAGNQFYCRVQDDGAPSGGATKGLEAAVRGWEVKGDAADVDDASNDGPFPAVASTVYARKSNSSDTVNRSWIVAADDRTFYVMIVTGDSTTAYYGWAFGDIYSYKSGDGYRTMLVARTTTGSSTLNETLPMLVTRVINATDLVGHYLARSYTGLGATIGFNKAGIVALSGNTTTGTYSNRGNLTFPNLADGGLYIAPVEITEHTNANVRGRMRGFWHLCHAQTNFADQDVWTAPAGSEWAGRSFIVIKPTGLGAENSQGGAYLIETSAWDTSS